MKKTLMATVLTVLTAFPLFTPVTTCADIPRPDGSRGGPHQTMPNLQLQAHATGTGSRLQVELVAPGGGGARYRIRSNDQIEYGKPVALSTNSSQGRHGVTELKTPRLKDGEEFRTDISLIGWYRGNPSKNGRELMEKMRLGDFSGELKLGKDDVPFEEYGTVIYQNEGNGIYSIRFNGSQVYHGPVRW